MMDKAAQKGVRSEDYRQRHVVPAGTTIYWTTTNPNEDVDGLKYVSYIDVDRQHYKGGWVRETQKADVAYENTYTLQKDIVVPSRNELSRVICDIMKADPSMGKKVGEHWMDMAYPEGSISKMEVMYANTNDVSVAKKLWKGYVDAKIKEIKDMPASALYYTSAQTLGTNTELRDKVISELKKRGYNAMTDEASVGGQNGFGREGVDPLIIFDSSGMLQKNGTSRISSEDESKSRKNYNKWRSTASAAKSRNASWSQRGGVIL